MQHSNHADEKSHHWGTVALFEEAAKPGQEDKPNKEGEFQELGEALIADALPARPPAEATGEEGTEEEAQISGE